MVRGLAFGVLGSFPKRAETEDEEERKHCGRLMEQYRSRVKAAEAARPDGPRQQQ